MSEKQLLEDTSPEVLMALLRRMQMQAERENRERLQRELQARVR